MSVEIKELTEKLHQKCLELDTHRKVKLDSILKTGNSFVDLMASYIARYSVENDQLLKTVLDELFVDIHVSVALAAGGQIKSSCAILRTVTELGLYLIFFIDHPVEARMWGCSDKKSNNCDMSFSKTLEQIATTDYLKSAAKKTVNPQVINLAKSELQNCYRQLSERVHGKYKFLQYASDDEESMFESYCNTALLSLKSLVKIAVERADEELNVFEVVPSLRGVL